MISIAILAVVSSIGFVSYNNSQIFARDGKRKENLRAIATAMEVFYQANNRYPNDGVGGATGCTYGSPATYCTSKSSTDPWIPELTINYINALPRDPLSDSSTPWTTKAGYSYKSCTTSSYTLTAYLENANDPDADLKKDYKFCDGSDISTGLSWSSNLYVITVR